MQSSRNDLVFLRRPCSQFDFDIAVTAGCFDYFAALCETKTGTTSQLTPGYVNFTLRQPFGVTGAQVPSPKFAAMIVLIRLIYTIAAIIPCEQDFMSTPVI